MVHFLAVATIAASTFAVTPAKVNWQADYGKALAATKNDQRPLLVVLDNPADPAATFDAKLLAAEGEQADLLKSYRLCRVDVSTEYGQKVAEAFGAKQFVNRLSPLAAHFGVEQGQLISQSFAHASRCLARRCSQGNAYWFGGNLIESTQNPSDGGGLARSRSSGNDCGS